VLYKDDLSEKDAYEIANELNKSFPSPTDENLYYVEKASNSRFNYGNINKRFLNSIDIQYKQNILRNIANHYGINIVDAEKEVTDVESELLEEYITDISLRRKVYSDRINRRYADGGGVGNVLLQVGDVVVIYPNYASIYTNSKGEIVDIMPDGKTYEIKIKRNKNGDNEYVKFDKSELKFIGGKGTFYDNGGGVEIAEIPTRERTTITKPTTTPTTTPSKPDKDSPYKPKGIPKPKATRM
jgi:hypothetical protein